MPPQEARKGTSLGFHIYPTTSSQWTIGEPEKIIWSSIHHLCSRNVAMAVAMNTYGITRKRDREALTRNLKLYVQQAFAFYETAKEAKANTAPLIYYYSFLNLAKAVCELHSPNFHEKAECYRHGMNWRPDSRRFADPATEYVRIGARGIWHTLWESVMLRTCPAVDQTKLHVRELFSYCPDVGIEYDGAFGKDQKLLPTKNLDARYDPKGEEVWLKFDVEREWFKIIGVSAPTLMKQIATDRSGYVEVSSVDKRFRTFQSAIPAKSPKGEAAAVTLRKDVIGLNIFAHLGKKTLEYSFPIQTRLPCSMSELMVYYTILYWLGSLVRYDPHSVNWLMDSRYWTLIDGFMTQSRLWLLELFEWELYQAETTLLLSR